MAKIEDLIERVAEPELRSALAGEIRALKATMRFGLVYEDHIPEVLQLPSLPVRVGSLVVQEGSDVQRPWTLSAGPPNMSLRCDTGKNRCLCWRPRARGRWAAPRRKLSRLAMALSLGQVNRWAMIRARITYERRNGCGDRVLDLEVGEQYGLTADVAHELLLFALTAAKKPVVFDVSGRFYRVPRQRLRSVAVWATPNAPIEPPAT